MLNMATKEETQHVGHKGTNIHSACMIKKITNAISEETETENTKKSMTKNTLSGRVNDSATPGIIYNKRSRNRRRRPLATRVKQLSFVVDKNHST